MVGNEKEKNVNLWASIKNDAVTYQSKDSGLLSILRLFFTNHDFKVLFYTRIINALYKKGGLKRILARLLHMHCVAVSSCHINPYSQIGQGVRLMHATGIAIGRSAVIKDNVTIYQHVTIGQKKKSSPACPVIENDVVIYAGAVLIGEINIGSGSIIGANVVIDASVEKDSVVKNDTNLKISKISGRN